MSKGSKQKGVHASVWLLVSQREPLICREQPGRRALTGHGVTLTAGMGDVNGGGHADVWEQLRDARLSRDTWWGLGGRGCQRSCCSGTCTDIQSGTLRWHRASVSVPEEPIS